MRKARTALLLSVLVPLAGAVPVITPPAAVARAVTPEVRSQALKGVDRVGVVRRSLLGKGEGKPEVQVSRTRLAPFKMLGITWQRPARKTPPPELTVLVRTHNDKGWTAWQRLDPGPTPRPQEARRARAGTEPLWTGPSDGYQVRVDVTDGALPPGLRVDLIDPGASPADAAPRGRRPMQRAAAAGAQPLIYTRADWGADENLRRTAPSYSSTIKAGFVHHTAGSNNYTEAQVPQILRAIYAYHVRGNGWSDIGYNFLVDRFGRTWEGRYGGMDRAVAGAHTGGFNVNTFAVSAIGNYDKVEVPYPTVDAIARVMAWKLSLNFRDPNGFAALTSQGGTTSRYAAGATINFSVISAHRDAGRTSCPGRNLYTQMSTIRSLATSYMGTTMYSPRVSPTIVTYGTGATMGISARVNSDQQWRLEVRAACRGVVVRTLTGSASTLAPIGAVWDLRDDTGVEVRPGAYSLSLTSADANGSSYTFTRTVTVRPMATSPPVTASPVAPGRTGFVPVDPVRLYDTTSDGNLPLGARQQVSVPVAGAGRVPDTGVGAVALNITSSCATTPTAVFAWPSGAGRPGTAVVNVPAGQTTSGMAVVALGGDGQVTVQNWAGSTELAVDVVGYYPLAGGQVFRPAKTIRLYDSRKDPAGPITAGSSRVVAMPPTMGKIPASAMTGALVNVTAMRASGTGWFTVQSPSSSRDTATVAYAPGRPVKNRAVAKLQDGSFKIAGYNGAAHVRVDLVGWWAPPEVAKGRLFQPRSAARVLDTRWGVGAPRSAVGAKKVLRVRVAGRGRPVPKGARAVVLNLTALHATRPTYVTAWPLGWSRPKAADLSVPAWRTTSNLVVVRVGRKNKIGLRNFAGSTHLVGEIVGYYP